MGWPSGALRRWMNVVRAAGPRSRVGEASSAAARVREEDVVSLLGRQAQLGRRARATEQQLQRALLALSPRRDQCLAEANEEDEGGEAANDEGGEAANRIAWGDDL